MFGWQGEGRVTHEIVELLSKSTEDDDHGATYRTLASFVEDVLVARLTGRLVLRLDQQPVVFLFARPVVHAHQMPETVQLLAIEFE